MPSIDEEIFNMKIKNPYKGGNIRLISIKNEGIEKPEYNMKKAGDKALADRLFAIGLPEAKWKVRQYFNQALYGGGKSKYWQGVLKKLNEHSEKFAEALIDVILKVNLYDRLKKKDVDESEFDFQVTTGTGGVTPKGKVTINDSTNFPINTSCSIFSDFKNLFLLEPRETYTFFAIFIQSSNSSNSRDAA